MLWRSEPNISRPAVTSPRSLGLSETWNAHSHRNLKPRWSRHDGLTRLQVPPRGLDVWGHALDRLDRSGSTDAQVRTGRRGVAERTVVTCGLAARAAVKHLRLLFVVNSHVPRFLVAARKPPAADVAGERLFPGMSAQVCGQMVAAAERPLTDEALEWPLTGVDSDVAGELVTAWEAAVARLRGTRKRPVLDGNSAGTIRVFPRLHRHQFHFRIEVKHGPRRRGELGGDAVAVQLGMTVRTVAHGTRDVVERLGLDDDWRVERRYSSVHRVHRCFTAVRARCHSPGTRTRRGNLLVDLIVAWRLLEAVLKGIQYHHRVHVVGRCRKARLDVNFRGDAVLPRNRLLHDAVVRVVVQLTGKLWAARADHLWLNGGKITDHGTAITLSKVHLVSGNWTLIDWSL